MNKSKILMMGCLIGAAYMTTACGGGKSNDAANDNDSISAAMNGNASDEQNGNGSDAIAAKVTPDLAFLEAKGPVKRLKDVDGNIFLLNKNGEIIELNCEDPFSVSDNVANFYDMKTTLSRDKNGYISEMSGWEWGNSYTWKDGKVAKVSNAAESTESEYEYVYNEKGELVKIDGWTGDVMEEEKNEEVITYTYTKYDEYGNWIEREALIENSDGQHHATESRVITYYPSGQDSSTAKDEFDVENNNYEFVGSIGTEKDATLVVGPDGGYYKLKSGKRDIRLALYDSKTGEIVMKGYLNQTFIGWIEGTVKDGKLNAIFTHCVTYDKIDIKMSLKK